MFTKSLYRCQTTTGERESDGMDSPFRLRVFFCDVKTVQSDPAVFFDDKKNDLIRPRELQVNGNSDPEVL